MKERPILFSGAMVRAILEGRKTVTRRVVKPRDLAWMDEHQGLRETCNSVRCPYGLPGDRLWVRESWARIRVAQAPGDEWTVYRECDNRTDFGGPWKPSIHMRRRDSRILLEITAVRVERLQDISEIQAEAEGAPRELAELESTILGAVATYRAGFARLWKSINGSESWAANPWVWVVEFKRVTP